MTSCSPVPTPMVHGTQPQEEMVERVSPEVVQVYQSLVRPIMYPVNENSARYLLRSHP